MFSMTQVAQAFQMLSASSGTSNGANPQSIQAVTSMLALSAVSGISPDQLIPVLATISGSAGLGGVTGTTGTGGITAMLTQMYGPNLTAQNVTPTLNALQQALPTMQGLQVGGGSQIGQAMGLFQTAINAGMTPGNLGDVANLIGNLGQVGTSPNLQQQVALGNTFGFNNLTADTAYTQYQSEEVGRQQQIATLGLQQNINGQGLSLPNLNIQIDTAQVQMNNANLQTAALQLQGAQLNLAGAQLGLQGAQLNLAYGQASYAFQQQQLQEEYGPIGQDQSGLAGYSLAKNQLAGQASGTSPEIGTQFTPQQPQGLQNQEFYAGIQNQQNMLILNRSPLLADAAFQQQMKYLNQQQSFYQQQLTITNQGRSFTQTWQPQLLAQQAKEVDQQAKQVALQAQQVAQQEKVYNLQKTQNDLQNKQIAYDIKVQEINQAFLGRQATALESIETSITQFLQGQGPLKGQNVTTPQLIQQIASEHLSPAALQQRLNQLGLSPADMNTMKLLVQQAEKQPISTVVKGMTSASDKKLMQDLQKQVTSGASTYQQAQMSIQNAYLDFAGTDVNWQNFSGTVKSLADAADKIAQKLAPAAPAAAGVAGGFNILGPAVGATGLTGNILGFIQGILGQGAGTAAGVGAAGGIGAAAGTLGLGGLGLATLGIGGSIAGGLFNYGSRKDNSIGTGIIRSMLTGIFPGSGLGTAIGEGQNIGDMLFGGSDGKKAVPQARPHGGYKAVTNPAVGQQSSSGDWTKGLQTDWANFWNARGKDWLTWLTARGVDFVNWLIKINKSWDTWWANRATDFAKWLITVNKSWDTWWAARAVNFVNWLLTLGKDWNNFWNPIFANFGKWVTGLPATFATIGTNVVNAITTGFNTFFTKTVPTLISNALKAINPFGSGGTGGTTATGAPSGFITPHVNAAFHQKMNYGIHQGVDFAASQGTPLKEYVGGRVTNQGWYPWGGEVDVAVPGGLTERYLHLSAINVKTGQTLKRGQLIGLTGGGTPASGLGYWSSGAHSHVQFDKGNINAGLDPWPIWSGFGDKNISQYYGTVGKSLAQGGVALSPTSAWLADGGVPEAIVPLNKLSSVLQSLPTGQGGMGGGTTTHTTSTKVSDKIEFHFHGNGGSGGFTDAEKDELMTTALDLLGQALAQTIKTH